MSLEATAAALRARPKLHTEKLVLISLADHHNRSTGRCFPKISTIMADAMVSHATAFRCLTSLEEQGLLKRHPVFAESGRQMQTEYELLFLGGGGGSHAETGEGLNVETPKNRKKEQEGTPSSSDLTASPCPFPASGDLLGETTKTDSQPEKGEASSRGSSRKKSRVSAEVCGDAIEERARPSRAAEGANDVFEVRAKWTKSAPLHDLAHWLLARDSAGYEELSRRLVEPGHVRVLARLVSEFGRDAVVDVVKDHFAKDHLGECRSPLVASFPEPPRKHRIVSWLFFRPALIERQNKLARFAA